MVFRSLLLILAVFSVGVARAQEFVPPRPPPLDPATDFEDMEEDMMEMGDEGYRPPPPPPPPGGTATMPPPEIRPPVGGNGFTSGMKDVKLKFKLVDEYWEKGKKRGRGKKIRVSGS
jgi:hypothetical protein